jgi:hypothetical protein
MIIADPAFSYTTIYCPAMLSAFIPTFFRTKLKKAAISTTILFVYNPEWWSVHSDVASIPLWLITIV